MEFTVNSVYAQGPYSEEPDDGPWVSRSNGLRKLSCPVRGWRREPVLSWRRMGDCPADHNLGGNLNAMLYEKSVYYSTYSLDNTNG